MQLRFNHEELKLLAEILEELASSREGNMKKASYDLLDRVIAHDLRFGSDELENLQDLLSAYKNDLRQRTSVAPETMKQALKDRAKLLESVMDKVTEACAMV